MGAPIVVNTVKVQGTVSAGGTTAILGTVNINNAVTIGSYDSTGTAKIMPIGGTNELTQWVPLGMNAGRLLTDTVISSGTVTSAESIPSGTLSSGTESLVPSGFVDSSTGNWTYLTLNSGSVPATVSGTVEISGNPVVSNSESVAYSSSGVGFSGSVFPVGVLNSSDTWSTLRIENNKLTVAPDTNPAYVSGTVFSSQTSPSYVTGTVLVNTSSISPIYITNSGVGALSVSLGTSLVNVQGTTTATIPASAPAYISGTVTSNAGSGTRLVNNTATSALYVQGTTVANVTGTVGISNQQLTVINNSATALYTRNTDANALYVQGTTTTNIPSISPAYVTGTVQVSNGTIAVSSVGGSVETYTNGTTIVSILESKTSSDSYTVGNDKFLPTGGTTDSGFFIPLGINSSDGRLITDTLVSGGTVSANEAVLVGSGLGTTNVIPIGVLDSTNSWTYLSLDANQKLSTNTSGTVEISAGTITVGNNITVSNNSATALYVQGTVSTSGTRPVSNTNTSALFIQGTTSISGTANVIERGSTIGQGSVTIGTAMGTVLTTSSTRRAILIQNLGTDFVWLGGSTAIVVNTGARLAPGQSISIDKSPISAIYAVASSGSQVLSYLTESD